MKRVFCPHCSQQKTYQEHRRLYFDERWQQPLDTTNILSSGESSDISSQCSEPSSIDNLEDDPYQHVQISPPSSMDESVSELFMEQQPEATSLRGSTGHNSDEGSSAGEEDWDESDIEIDDSITNENHPQAKSFVKWIAALILGFQAAYVFPYNATQWLFTFHHILFTTLRTICSTPFILAVCMLLPGSLYLAWRLLKVDEDEFIRYVVCPKCDSIYRFEECIKFGTQLLSKRCSYVAFKNHPQRRYRAPCNTLLLKSVILKGGKKKLVARKEYPYMSIIQS